MHYEYVYLESRDRLNSLSPDAENDHAKLDKIRQDANRKMNEVSDVVYVLFLWQERLFYMGLVIVGVFGIYSI
jgi:hypothetical protein